MTDRVVTITPASPAGLSGVTFSLVGDATYQPASSGSGGWQTVDRPRNVAAMQWYDRSPKSLDLKMIVSSRTIYGYEGGSIEPQCNLIETWADKVPGTQIPPILNITGPVPGIQYVYCLYNYVFNEAIRDPQAGFRIQQNVELTLYEYNAPLQGILASPAPAIAWIETAIGQDNQSSYLLYTVVSGDTLASIAARFLGNQSEWPEIASLNGLRDPNNVQPGQTIKLPQS